MKKKSIVRKAKLQPSWYQEDDPTDTLIGTVRLLYQKQSRRYNEILFWLRMYGEDLADIYGFNAVISAGSDEPLPLNVTQAVIDTSVSKLVRIRPRTVCAPVGGGFTAQKTATHRTMLLDGLWQETNFRAMSRDCAIDAHVTGVGLIKAYIDQSDLGAKIVHDRVFAEDVVCDPKDARKGNPRCLYHCEPVDRGVAIALYPDCEEDILAAGMSSPQPWNKTDADTDQITIWEGWHLPDGPTLTKKMQKRQPDESWEQYQKRLESAKWGRHVVCVEGKTIVDEPWTLPRFPFVFFFSKPPRRGFWPQSMAERLYGYQAKIWDLAEMIFDNIATHGNLKMFMPEGSSLYASDMDNEPGGTFYFTGQRKPEFGPQMMVPPEVYSLLWQLVGRSFQQEGQSELHAHGEVPTGMAGASGTALRTITGIATGRDMVAGLNWDDAHKNMAELDLMLCGQAAESDPSFSALYIGKHDGAWMSKRMRWVDVDQGGEYVINMESTADTPRTLSGKLAMFGELEERGIPTVEESMKAVQLESVDRILELRTAGRRSVEWALDQIVETGEYIAPEPFMPLTVARDLGLSYYAIALRENHPAQELLVQWINETEAWLKKMAAEMAPQQEMMPPPGPGPEGGL